ncbi:MAG: hypothetical protein HN526_16250 [Gammaproteobacteria bacterium]|jgi:hypothetical protein|nr:hypothetical protein [Gammaproteobacteria bacterium]
MSTDLNDLSLLLDAEVPIPVSESSREQGATKRKTDGLNHLGFDGEPAIMVSPLRPRATDKCVFANE